MGIYFFGEYSNRWDQYDHQPFDQHRAVPNHHFQAVYILSVITHVFPGKQKITTRLDLQHWWIHLRFPTALVFFHHGISIRAQYVASCAGCGSRDEPAVMGPLNPLEIEGNALRAKSQFIADSLYINCVLPDSGERLKRTAAISPASNLKCIAARKAFVWANYVGEKKKFFTMAACREAIKLLLGKDGVEVPFVGLSRDMWIESQAKVIMHLAQRSRMNCGSSLRFVTYRQSKLMDWQDTLPLEAGPVQLDS